MLLVVRQSFSSVTGQIKLSSVSEQNIEPAQGNCSLAEPLYVYQVIIISQYVLTSIHNLYVWCNMLRGCKNRLLLSLQVSLNPAYQVKEVEFTLKKV